MITFSPSMNDLAVETQNFYRRAVHLLNEEEIPFLVGGAYALAHYTGIVRHTKDFDVFLRKSDFERALDAFTRHGYHTEVTFSHWLGKAYHGEDFVDFIFSSGNGIARIDEQWFEHSNSATFLGEPILLCPAEEIIWSKGFICERERFDGADINHLILARGHEMDWHRLLDRFGDQWRVLYAHLVLFGFVYPSERTQVPAWVMDKLTERIKEETLKGADASRVCQGTLLSRIQYCIDMDEWDFSDARLSDPSNMSRKQTELWTDAGLRQH